MYADSIRAVHQTRQHAAAQPLLQLSNGQQLIRYEWLQKGLPGYEYVHADLLTSSTNSSSSSSSSSSADHNKRAHDVLLALGAAPFSAGVLVQWLTAAGLQALLQGLTVGGRDRWLQDLYMCLNRLVAQVDGPLSLADAGKWSIRLSAAPILPLLGQSQLTSHTAATSNGRVFLWDPALRRVAALLMPASSAA